MDAYLDLAEEMEEKEPQYLSVLGTRKRAVSQLEVSVEAAGSSAEEEKHADFVREFIARDTLSDELFDLMDAVGKGFSVSNVRKNNGSPSKFSTSIRSGSLWIMICGRCC